jgi:hypothetical protein
VLALPSHLGVAVPCFPLGVQVAARQLFWVTSDKVSSLAPSPVKS